MSCVGRTVELVVGHGVEVLKDEVDGVPVAGRVDHKRTDGKAREVVDGRGVDGLAAVHQLAQCLNAVHRAEHGVCRNLDTGRLRTKNTGEKRDDEKSGGMEKEGEDGKEGEERRARSREEEEDAHKKERR